MSEKIVIGWRENLSLPALGIKNIKVKADTGAKTSCLHAFNIETFTKLSDNPIKENDLISEQSTPSPLKNEELWVRFWTQSGKYDIEFKHQCEAKVIDIRTIRNSGGYKEKRYVIQSDVKLGSWVWPIEITLTNRKEMAYAMLLGRRAMHDRIMVDPTESYLIEENQ